MLRCFYYFCITTVPIKQEKNIFVIYFSENYIYSYLRRFIFSFVYLLYFVVLSMNLWMCVVCKRSTEAHLQLIWFGGDLFWNGYFNSIICYFCGRRRPVWMLYKYRGIQGSFLTIISLVVMNIIILRLS